MNLETLIKELNKAENDNKKFALLVILSQLIKTNKIKEFDTEDETEEKKQIYERLFHAINPHFLARLLVTSQVPENCSKSIFKSVAMSILTKFSQYKDLACDPILLSKVKQIISILKSSKIRPEDDEELKLEENLVENTFNYLFALSKYCSNHLCKNGLLDVLLDEFILDEQQNNSTINISIQLFSKLCEYDAKYCNFESKNEIGDSLLAILQKIEMRQDELKFKLIKMFEKLVKLNPISEYLTVLMRERPEITNTVLKVFGDLFKTKNLKPVVKDNVFSLFSYFIENNEKFLDEIYTAHRQLFYLIAHLVSIEIRLGLEDNTKCFSELAMIKEAFLDRLSIYYTVFEKFIIFIAISPLINTDIDEKQMSYLLNITIETMNTIISFLKDVLTNKEYEKLDGCEDYVRLNGYLIVIASIRVLTCWFAYEELLEYEIIDLLSDVVKFGDHYVGLYKDTANFINVFQFLTPGLHRFVNNNEEVVDEMCKNVKMKDYDVDLVEKFSNVKQMMKYCDEKV
jgi:hypothetical protein